MAAQGGGGVDTSIDSPFSAWISSTQAQVTFTDPSNDLTARYVLYSSQDPSCDIASVSSCPQGQQTTLDTFPASVTITAWTLNTDGTLDTDTPAYYILENRNNNSLKRTNTNDIVLSTHAFLFRRNHQLVVFNKEMYMIGGIGGNSGNSSITKNDIWRSGNGTDWTEVTASAAFSIRHSHQVVVFKGTMYLIGGQHRLTKNDIWRSSDGIVWTEVEVTSDAGFSARFDHQVVALNDRIYIIGGRRLNTNTGFFDIINDVWRSSNGEDWTEVTSDAGFPNRSQYQVVAFKDKMYLIGGGGSIDPFTGLRITYNDVWSSSNGTNWTEVTSDAGFPARYSHQVVVFNDRIYLIGGITPLPGNKFHYYDDVWSSSNGTDWTQDTAHAAFSARVGHQVVEFNDRIYVIGGYDGTTKNDVWRSSNGSDWMRGYSGTFVFE